MIPRPGSGQTLVPKAGNPNVFNVYQPMGDFSDVIAGSVTPTFRPSPGGGVGVVGMDDEDNFPGLSSPKAASLRSASEEGGHYGKRTLAPGERTQRNTDQGVFIPDAETGTPLDPFDMEALRRHTQRQLALMHQPAVKFAASVAQKIGKNPDSMLVNGGALLDPQAANVRAMFTSSPLAQASLAQAVSVAVVELLRGTGRRTSEGEPLKAPKVEPVVNSNLDWDELAKFEQKNPVEQAINAVYQHIGVRNVFSEAARDMRAQPNAAPDPTADMPTTSILRQLAEFLTSAKEENSTARWVWNSLPENSGIAIIRPDVVEAMEDCHAMIREHIPDVQMWHLITGAHVRGQFAKMVSEYINEAPGELQYPNFQSTRGPNVLTSSRISAGKFREERAVQRVRYLKRWFSNVAYGPSESWKYVQDQPYLARSRVVDARSDVTKWLELCYREVDSLWKLLLYPPDGDQGAGYSDIVQDHAVAKHDLASAEAAKAVADLNYTKGLQDKVIRAEEQSRLATAQKANDEVIAAKQYLEYSVKLFQDVGITGLRRRFGVHAEHVYALWKAFENRNEDAITKSSEDLREALTGIINKVSLYAESDDDNTMLLGVLTAVTSLKQAITAVKDAQRALVTAEKNMITFPEADKRELFHHVPNPSEGRPAMLSYGTSSRGMYASW